AGKDYFRGVLASGLNLGVQGSQVGESVNGFGVLGGSALDLGQGPMVTTANPLDLALDGHGMFAIQTAQGVRYTRDGAFVKSEAGQIQTQRGEAVLDAQMQPITVPSGTVAVSGDGTVSIAGAVAGKVGVFDFAAGSLTAEGTNRFVASAGAAATVGDAQVKQGAVEGANEDAVHGTMQLILVQRQAEMMQKALGVFDSGFDKTAVEELSRV
ncbi:MAG: flagellar hook basal-body protein, partial [Chloroflexota bacterium]|nr:flagellar hook basal-body protein [Chloroflexota bacterium]